MNSLHVKELVHDTSCNDLTKHFVNPLECMVKHQLHLSLDDWPMDTYIIPWEGHNENKDHNPPRQFNDPPPPVSEPSLERADHVLWPPESLRLTIRENSE